MTRPFLAPYEGDALHHLSFPIGGLGSGMFCLDGAGALSHVSFRHQPELFHEPLMFSAISINSGRGNGVARVLEGPVPPWKLFLSWNRKWDSSGMGGGGRGFGLPRFASARFDARFPFAQVSLADPKIPLEVGLVGWSPFIPGDADSSSLPVGALEYRFKNTDTAPVDLVYSFHAQNFLAAETGHGVKGIPGGFHLYQEGLPDRPATESSFVAWIDSPDARANLAWFRGGWFDPLTMLWNDVAEGRVVEKGPVSEGKSSIGGSVYLKFHLLPNEEKTIRLLLAWYTPYSTVCVRADLPEKVNPDPKTDCYRPWYASQFSNIQSVASHWTRQVEELRQKTQTFTDSFYDSTLPPEIIEAVAANLSILKSPTVLRQFDGRFWAWEGSKDDEGSCPGTCTHVWNYAQALPHLFPALERGVRETEFIASQDERGHQSFRASLPIGPTGHAFHAAADGQLGGLLKVYRDWRISGDTEWLRGLWPRVRQSLNYCIATWDPDHRGAPFEPHHNTYDVEFWGADGMCGSFYLAALDAAIRMGQTFGDDVALWKKILAAGKRHMEGTLYNGEYFIQDIQWTGLHAASPVEMSKRAFNVDYSPEALEILQKEGPKYQYEKGCLSDGVLGEWMAWTAGLEPVLAPEKIEQHLLSVHRHNYRPDFSPFANPQRPAYAFGREAGLVLCSWPKGEKPSLPFPYSDEVWTGIEYQVAAHLISIGRVSEGLEIVRACRRRYDGTIRNPFDEMECGHWYARAMASYSLLQAFTGARYDAVDRILYLQPKMRGNFRSFLATATGFGTVGVKDGKPFLDVRGGQIEVNRIVYISI